MRTLTSAMMAFFALCLSASLQVYAESACVTCQNDCYAQVEVCQEHDTEEDCMDAYGDCKLGCKGSPVCLEKCDYVTGSAKDGETWHGAACNSDAGCNCKALECAKAPQFRDATCASASE